MAVVVSIAPAEIGPSGESITAVILVPDADTDLTYSDDGYGYDGTARVVYDPPVAAEPAGIQRVKVKRVHQSLPAPTLVNGRPT